MKTTTTRLMSFIISLMVLFTATASLAANGVWNGTADALWTNSANWSAAYPSGAETATFTNGAPAITTIDVSGLTSINNIIFDFSSVAAYTVGTGAANSQPLVLGDNGIIALNGAAGNSQVFNAGLQLGTTIAGSTYTLTNGNTTQTLTFNNVFGPASGGAAGGKTLVVSGAGTTTILGGLVKGGASSMTLSDRSSGTVTVMGTNTINTVFMEGSGTLMLPGSNTVTTLNMNGTANSVVDIGDGVLALSAGGGTTLTSSQGGIINGSGKLWLSGVAGAYADNNVAPGKTLTINTSIISAGGFEFWGATPPYGTFVLNATNTFDLDVLYNVAGTISVWKIGNKGSTTSNLGKGNKITFNANATPGAKLLYTGTGEESDRTLELTYNAIIDHSGTGLLKFVAPPTTSGNIKTLTLQGSTSGLGEIAGAIPNGTGTSLEKTGTGTWILSAVNTYPGATTIKNGKLIVTTAGSCASSAVKVQSSGAGATAVLSLSVPDSDKQWVCASLTTTNDLSGGNPPVLDFTFYTTPGSSLAPLSVTGNVVFDSQTAITVNPAHLLPGSSYPLLTAGGSVPATAPTSVTIGGGLTGSVSWGTGNPYSTKTLVLTVSGSSAAAQPLHWAGTGAGTWNINTPGNLVWTNSATPPEAAYYQEGAVGDQVIFDDMHIRADQAVTLDEAVKPSWVTFDNSLYGYTVTGGGSISGFTSLNKLGTNTLTLGTTNTYSDITALKAGTLKLGSSMALPTGNIVSMSGTATLDLNGYATAIGNISDSFASNVITDSSEGSETNAFSILNHATKLSAFIKDGTSKKVALTLRNSNANYESLLATATNTFSGGLLLKNGAALGAGTRLRIMSPVTTLGTPGNITSSPFGTGPIMIGEAGTDKAQILLDTVSNNTIANDIVVNTSLGTDVGYALRVETAGNSVRGAVKVNADLTFGGAGVATLDNVISGVGGVRVVGGTLNLTGANTYSGKTTIAGGVLAVPLINNVGSASGPLGNPATAADGAIRIGSGGTGATLRYIGAGETTDRWLDMAGTTGNATLDHSGTNLLKITSDLLVSGNGNKWLILRGPHTGSFVSTGEVAGVISDSSAGTVSLEKNGTNSVWRLSKANQFTGGVNISIGILIITDSGALGESNKTVTITNGTVGNPQLHLDGSAAPIVLGTNITFLTSNQTDGSLHNVAGNNIIKGKVTLTGGGGATILNSWAGKLTCEGNFTPDQTGRELYLRGHGDGEISGVIANGTTVALPLKRDIGGGTWTLSGMNTYTGPTTIKAGTLLVNGSTASASAMTVSFGAILGGKGTINGTVSVTAGGMLAPGGINATNTLTLANNSASSLTLNNGILLFDLPSEGLACDKIDITGASGKLVLTGANKIALSFPYGSAPEGVYTLMTCSGGITLNAGASLALQSAYPNATLSIVGNDVILTVGVGGTSGMTWQGNLSDVWDGGILNWTNGSAAASFEPGQNVVFDDTAVNFAVSSGSPVAPASVLFNNSDNDYTVSAAMDGATTLTKLGSGALTLSGTNTYTGPTIIGGGRMSIGGAGLLGNGLYATNIFSIAGSEFNYASSEPQTLSGVLSGEGTLSKEGAATLTLAAANTYVGPTIVNAGILKIQNASALGTTAAGTTVNAGGTLELAGNISAAAEALNLYGVLSSQTGSNTYTGVVTLRAGSSLDAGPGAFLILTASTPDVGAAPFSKTGAGTVRLTADPNHRGICTVAGGTLELMGGGGTDADFIIDAGATLRETTANLGDYRLTNNGTFDIRVNDQIGALDGSGVVAIGNTGSYTFSVGGANQSGAFSGVIQDGTGKMSFQKNGSGVQILTGVNTYTGTTVVAGGTLLVNNLGSLAANSAVTVNNFATLGGSGTINGTVNVVAGGTLLPGDTNAIATLTLANTSGTTLTLNGNVLRYDLSNVAGVSDMIVLTGTGGLVLNGVNSIALSFPNGAAPAGDYTLMTFNSYTGTGSFVLPGNYPGNASLELTANSLILHVTSASASSGMTWRGPQSGIWDNGTQNWTTNNSDLVAYTPGSAVIFDDTATGYFTISSGSPVFPASVFFNNSVNAYTVSALIEGTGALVKQGAAAVTLSGVNGYNPSLIDIYPGSLTLGAASSLNSGVYAGSIINNGTFAFASSMSQTLSGNISGSGSLNKSGNSTLILSGTNTYSGATTVSGGILKIRSEYARGTTAGNMTVGAGTKLEMESGVNTLTEQLLLTGTLSCPTGVTTCANNIYTYTGSIFDVAAGATLILSGSTADTGAGNSIIKTNAGLLRLTRDPNHKGTMTIKGGAVELAANTSDGDYVVNAGAALIGNTGDAINNNNGVTINAGGLYILRQSDTISAFTGTGTLTKDTAGGTTLTVGNNNWSGTFSGVIENGAGTISFTKNGTGTFSLAGTNTYTGNTTVNTGVLMIDGAGLLGNGLYTGAIVNKATLVYASTAPQTVSGVISDVGALRKIGTGRLTLTGINTYNGATSISNGILTGVTGGGCTNSAVTVQASPSGAVAILGVRYTGANAKWTCNSLTTSAGVSAPRLLFTFATTPSTTVAPLEVRGNVTFHASTVLQVTLPVNIGAGDYPLVLAGGTPSGTPTLAPLGNGLTGILAWGGTGSKTLILTITSTGATTQPLKWNQATSGAWNINVSGNAIWLDNAGTSTHYQESVVGDHVLFDDTVTGDINVTLSTTVNPASVSINNALANYTLSGSGGISGEASLTKSGTNMVTLATANTYQGGSTVSLGTLKVASGGSLSHVGADIIVGNTASTSSNALLKIESNASVQAKWLQAGTANGAVGAIHNKGTLAVSPATSGASFALGYGTGGYGYYRHDTVKGLTIGESGIAGANGGNGVLDVMQGTITNSVYFLANRANTAQYSQVNVSGGTLIMPDSNANAALFWQGSASGQGVINVGASSMLGSLGSSTELDLIKTSTSGSAIGILNIFDGGIVEASRIKATQGNGTALVSFNGGTLKAKYPAYGTGPLLGGSAVDRVTIYQNGAVIDTVGNDLIVSQPLLAPSGDGIIAIPVTAKGTGYIGRPVVYITGGGGTGATAVADYNPDTQEVTGIIVTSSGYGYTTPSGIVVTLAGGGGIPPTLGTASIGAMTSGGLTKIGVGSLTLSGASTYTGMTTISSGTLRLGAGNALPANAAVTLAGGDYDLSGLATTNGPINVISGSVLSGMLKASGITKSGDGVSLFTATLTDPAPIIIDKGTLLLSKAAGLYEGRVAGAFELALPNPQTGVQLCPTNAYRPTVNSNQTCGRWVDYSTYIYTGYIWNRSPTNELWTFCKSFDDSVLIKIDGTEVLKQSGDWDTVTTRNHPMTPGAHVFEVRLGQGSGGVGQANNKTVHGAGFDRLGRSIATLCVPILDPGDGSLLTHALVYGTNQLATASTLQVAANAALNLGGMVQTLADVSGSGLVTNGALTVTGVVAPGGLNVLGTLTLATTNTLTGTLRVDISEDGSCDVLAVKGDVDLTGMALTADVMDQLTDLKLKYTILTCTGTRTGTFGTKTLPRGWIVSYEENGDIKLLFAGGSVISIF